MADRNQLTRTCSSCGLEKPLAAFLEIGAKGTRYGCICATCRGTDAKQGKKAQDDEVTTISTQKGIGIKDRIYSEIEQQKQTDSNKISRIEQLQKRDQLTEDKKQKALFQEQSEKDHRDTYLKGIKQSSFLGKTIDKSSPVSTNKDISNKKQHELGHASQLEKQKQSLDLTNEYKDPEISGQIKEHNPTFSSYLDSQESSTPLKMKIMRERSKKLFSSQGKSGADTATATADKRDALLEFAEKTWGSRLSPSSRKR